MNTAVIISARLSSAHLLTLALGLGAIFLCGRLPVLSMRLAGDGC